MIQLRLLGSTELLDDRGVPMREAMRRQKALALLAYLAAARPRGAHRRDKIAALFWPELAADRARAALRVTLTRLREDVGERVVATTAAEDLLVRPEELSCDVVQLEDALAAGDAARAAALYRGHFMDAIHVEGTGEEIEEWMSLERRRLKDATTKALTEAARAFAVAGATTSAADFAQRAIEISPAEEPAYRVLMDLFVAAGDDARAIKAYEDFERALARAYDVAPPADLRMLVNRLRATPRPPAPIAPTSPAPGRAGRRSWPWLVGSVAAALVLLNAPRFARGSRPAAPVQWTPVLFAGEGRRPVGRIEAASVLNFRGDLISYGGQVYLSDSSTLLGEVWRLRGIGGDRAPFWTRLRPTGPAPKARWLFGMASDPRSDRVIVQGGALGHTSPCDAETWLLENASDTASAWRKVAIRDRSMPARAGYNAAYDPDSRSLIVFGGHDCVSTFFNETWVLAFDDSTLKSGKWNLLRPDTTEGTPASRSSYASAYDASRHRLYLFSGSPSSQPVPGLWMLDHAEGRSGAPSWRPLACAAQGPAYNGGSAVFDPQRETLYLFGGIDSASVFSRELWRVSGLGDDPSNCRWEHVTQADPAPGARMHASLFLDPRTQDLWLFGGEISDVGFADLWRMKRP